MVRELRFVLLLVTAVGCVEAESAVTVSSGVTDPDDSADVAPVRCIGVTLTRDEVARIGGSAELSAKPGAPSAIRLHRSDLTGFARREVARAKGRTFDTVAVEIRDDQGGVVASTLGPIPLTPRDPMVLTSKDGDTQLSILCGMGIGETEKLRRALAAAVAKAPPASSWDRVKELYPTFLADADCLTRGREASLECTETFCTWRKEKARGAGQAFWDKLERDSAKDIPGVPHLLHHYRVNLFNQERTLVVRTSWIHLDTLRSAFERAESVDVVAAGERPRAPEQRASLVAFDPDATVGDVALYIYHRYMIGASKPSDEPGLRAQTAMDEAVRFAIEHRDELVRARVVDRERLARDFAASSDGRILATRADAVRVALEARSLNLPLNGYIGAFRGAITGLASFPEATTTLAADLAVLNLEVVYDVHVDRKAVHDAIKSFPLFPQDGGRKFLNAMGLDYLGTADTKRNARSVEWIGELATLPILLGARGAPVLTRLLSHESRGLRLFWRMAAEVEPGYIVATAEPGLPPVLVLPVGPARVSQLDLAGALNVPVRRGGERLATVVARLQRAPGDGALGPMVERIPSDLHLAIWSSDRPSADGLVHVATRVLKGEGRFIHEVRSLPGYPAVRMDPEVLRSLERHPAFFEQFGFTARVEAGGAGSETVLGLPSEPLYNELVERSLVDGAFGPRFRIKTVDHELDARATVDLFADGFWPRTNHAHAIHDAHHAMAFTMWPPQLALRLRHAARLAKATGDRSLIEDAAWLAEESAVTPTHVAADVLEAELATYYRGWLRVYDDYVARVTRSLREPQLSEAVREAERGFPDSLTAADPDAWARQMAAYVASTPRP